MTNRCPVPGVPLTPGDQAEVDRFAAFLRDPDPNRGAAYLRHYPPDPEPLPEHFTEWVTADLNRHQPGCDCTTLCSMGPTCPGGMLARLPGAGCWRTEEPTP